MLAGTIALGVIDFMKIEGIVDRYISIWWLARFRSVSFRSI